MKAILDASTLINLSNGGVLQVVLRLPNWMFFVGPQVARECVDQFNDLSWAFDNGLKRLDDDAIPAAVFLVLLEEFGLGPGETECLTFALHESYSICCDDRKARDVCVAKLGKQRVLGTLRLLRVCVEHKLLVPSGAIAAYELMKCRGGFLDNA